MADTEPPTKCRPRWLLIIQAHIWRFLMGIGMTLHRMARPWPLTPAFSKTAEASISPHPGSFKLSFYVPADYEEQKRCNSKKRYPVVINFHGGGFVLGATHDDARWATMVVENVGAVVVSVDYRRAPEHPFPTAVEDGADAVLYLAKNATSLLLDPDRFALSGFSSGGNMAFTVPLCLQGELLDAEARIGNLAHQPISRSSTPPHSFPPSMSSSVTNVDLEPTASQMQNHGQYLTPPIPLDRLQALRSTGQSTLSLISTHKEGAHVSITDEEGTEVKLRGLVSFYPSTDYTQTRAQRRATASRPDHLLPAVFTELFDQSYLQPPSLDLSHPWLSPGVAPADMLAALPDDIVLFTCEWDMLLAEGERFRDRLRTDLGKRVHYHCVPEVPHGWDKAPNPLRETPGSREQYTVACRELKRMFDIPDM